MPTETKWNILVLAIHNCIVIFVYDQLCSNMGIQSCAHHTDWFLMKHCIGSKIEQVSQALFLHQLPGTIQLSIFWWAFSAWTETLHLYQRPNPFQLIPWQIKNKTSNSYLKRCTSKVFGFKFVKIFLEISVLVLICCHICFQKQMQKACFVCMFLGIQCDHSDSFSPLFFKM